MITEKDRIEKLMELEGLSPTQLAAEIGVNSSNISHIVTGRNNPSLDVMKKILDRYRTISSDWLILGVGPIYREIKPSQAPSLFDDENETVIQPESYVPESEIKELPHLELIREKSEEYSEISTERLQKVEKEIIKKTGIDKIIVYYSDNTYQEFEAK